MEQQKEAVELNDGYCGPWRVVGAAVEGVSHLQRGLPCQDAQGYRLLPAGGLVIAVSDGAGSAERSDEGAHCAVDSVLDALEELLTQSLPQTQEDWEAVLREAFLQAQEAVLFLAENEAERPRAFACTLSVAVIANGKLAAAQVGDGAVVALGAGGMLFALTHLQKGEYANETHFLIEEGIVDCLEVRVSDEPVNALAVMSDGLVRLALKLPSGEPHQPFFQPLFRFAAAAVGCDDQQATAQLEGFLNSERVCARTDDDKALVLAAYTGSTALVRIAPVNGTAEKAAAQTAGEKKPKRGGRKGTRK